MPEAGATEDETTFEAYIGAEFDVTLFLSVYVYYNFDLETLTVERSAKHKYKLTKSTCLKSKAFLSGYDPESGKSKYYLGAKTGVVYNFTQIGSGSIGIRFSDKEDKISKLYWAASFSAGF